MPLLSIVTLIFCALRFLPFDPSFFIFVNLSKNLNSLRDWGYAKDYVEAMWLMLQQEEPEDFVIATGEQHSIRDFVNETFKHYGVDIAWKGEGLDEIGIDKKTGNVLVKVNPKYFRPTEVNNLCGDASKANKVLGWKPKTSFKELVELMATYDKEKDMIWKRHRKYM